MRRISAHFIFTNAGAPLRRGIITVGDNGTIMDVQDTAGHLEESQSVEFYNGIIVPGFVNCHCHLELSHLKNAIPESTGLGEFLISLQKIRNSDTEMILAAAKSADKQMYDAGVELCADICNNSTTFSIKRNSGISYLNLLEVFATDPGAAETRIREIELLSEESKKYGLPFSIVPHTVYAVSLPLFRLIKEKTPDNKVTSIHFMETDSEESFLSDHSGALMDAFEKAGMLPAELSTPRNSASAILEEVTSSGSLILVHNTFADRETVRKVNKRENLYWCLCPNANLYIENRIPQVSMLIEEGCTIVTGTDSLASNRSLSILDELKTIHKYYPSVSLEDIIRWATVNGAKALGEDHIYGTIEPGKKPGLLLLEDADLINLKLTSDTSVSRLTRV